MSAALPDLMLRVLPAEHVPRARETEHEARLVRLVCEWSGSCMWHA